MKFRDFVEINPKFRLTKGEEYPYVEMADLDPSFGYVSNRQKRIFKSGGSKFEDGDTLFARITPCLENGKIARFKSNGGEKAFGSTEFFVFRAKEGISDPDYIFFLSKSSIIKETAEKSMTGASGRQRADVKAVEEVEIDPPDIKDQEKIASILSAFDDLIENNTRRIQILEEMARLIYKEWFVHFRYPGHESVPLVDSPLGKIPKGWELKKVIDLYNTSAGGTPNRKRTEYYNGSIPWIKTKKLNDSFIQSSEETITESGLKNSSAKLFPKNTVLVAMYGATVGQLGILDMDATTNQACCAVLQKTLQFDYSYIFLTLLENKAELIGLSQGAAQQNINQGHVKDFNILKPEAKILAAFQKIVHPMFDQLRILIRHNDILKDTRDLLLYLNSYRGVLKFNGRGRLHNWCWIFSL